MYELFNLKRIVVFGREVTTAWKVETAAKKHLCMKILVRIPMSVRIGRAESKAQIWDEMGEVLDAQEF